VSDSTQGMPTLSVGSHGWRWMSTTTLIAFGFFVVTFVIYFLPAMLGRPLTRIPESRVGAIAREMVQSGNYVVPNLGGEPYLELPPVPYWQAAISSVLFFGGSSGDTLQVTRATLFPPAINAALAVFLVVLFGSILFGRSSGISAGLVLAASDLLSYYAQSGFGDVSLVLSSAAVVCGVALLLSEKPSLGPALLAGFGLGFGILTKGHIPLLLIALPCGIELYLRRRSLTRFNSVYLAMAFMIALLVATPWFILVSRSQPNAIDTLIAEASHAFRTDSATPTLGLGYYFARIPFGLLPWTPLLLAVCVLTFIPLNCGDSTPSSERATLRFFALYAGIGFLMFLGAQRKYEHYLLPLLPALALVAGALFGRLNLPGGLSETRMGWTQLFIGIAGAFVIGYAPFWPNLLNALGFTSDGYLAARAMNFAAEIGGSALPLAGAFFVMCFIAARFWTSGEGVRAIVLIATITFAGIVYSNVNSIESARITTAWTEYISLRQLTDKLPTGSRIFSEGVNETYLIFQTGRLVKPLAKLAADTTPPVTPAYVLVSKKTDTLLGVPLGESQTKFDGYALIELTPILETSIRDALTQKTPGDH